MLEPQEYTRKTFTVEAVQVTPENIGEVATWCGGEVKTTYDPGYDENVTCVILQTSPSYLGEMSALAYPSDWITRIGDRYKVYNDNVFQRAFDKVEPMTDLHAGVQQLVRSAMVKQDVATYHEDTTGMDTVAEDTTKKILELVKKAGETET